MKSAPTLASTIASRSTVSLTVFDRLAASERGQVDRARAWGTSADGSFRFEITRFETAESVPPGISFSQP